MDNSFAPGSIADILVSIAKENDIHESVCYEYIRRHKVNREQVGDNINMEEEEVDSDKAAAEPVYKRQKGESRVRIGAFLQIYDDYFTWSQQTRITKNKDLQAHAHSNERKAKRKLDIERTSCHKARDALEREQTRLLGREAQFGGLLWAHVRKEGEHRRTFDQCVSKSAMFKKIAQEASEVELVSCVVQLRRSSSEPWMKAIISLKDGLLVWKCCEDSSVCGRVKMSSLCRLIAHPPYSGVASSGVLFGSCRPEAPSSSIGRCFGREVVTLDWGEDSLELAPLFDDEVGTHVSIDSASSASSLGIATLSNEEGVQVWSCQLCGHSNTDVSSRRCEECMSVPPPPPPPPPPRLRQRGSGRPRNKEAQISESFELLMSSLEFLLAVRLDIQPLPLLGTLVECPSLLKIRPTSSTTSIGARKKALTSRDPVIVHIKSEGRTSSEASSLPSSPSSNSTVWSPEEQGLSNSNHNIPKTISQILDDNLAQISAKLGIADNARHQVRCANLERTEAQASILRSVSRREKTLELLATLKQLQDLCRRPPLKGRNGKWMALPKKRSAVLSEVGRRLSQALEITSIPDLWGSSSSAMTSWPPIQNMHEQASSLSSISPIRDESSSKPQQVFTSPEDKGVKGSGKMSSVEMLRKKKRLAAEKRRQSHVRFLRNGVDDFAVEPSKLRVCTLIYEYQSEGNTTACSEEGNSSQEVVREHPELVKEIDRLKELVKCLWEKQAKFLEVAHELARERALLLWYIHAGHLLTGEEDLLTSSYSFASGSVQEFASADMFSSPSLSITSFYSPNPSFCEDGSPMHSRSLSNIGDLKFLQSAPMSFLDRLESTNEAVKHDLCHSQLSSNNSLASSNHFESQIGSPQSQKSYAAKQGVVSSFKGQSEVSSVGDLCSRLTETSIIDNEEGEGELYDIDF